jgi:hypothetical protein
VTYDDEARAAFVAARDPARLATAVVKFHRAVDAVVAATVEGHALRLACTRGCSYCCHLRLEVQPHEAFAIAAWLRRHFTPAQIEGVVERLRDNVARTEAIGTEGRKRTNIACALLGPDGTCSAYEARPAQCRRYHSLRVESCAEFHANPANETLESPLHPALAHNAAVIITQAQHAVRAAGLDAENVDFNLALLAALENPKAWRRWKDGKKPFASGRASVPRSTP